MVEHSKYEINTIYQTSKSTNEYQGSQLIVKTSKNENTALLLAIEKKDVEITEIQMLNILTNDEKDEECEEE